MLRSVLLTACLAGLLPLSLRAQASIGFRSGLTGVNPGLGYFGPSLRGDQSGRRPLSWENEFFYDHHSRSGWSFGAGLVFTKRQDEERFAPAGSMPLLPGPLQSQYKTGVSQLQLTALYDLVRPFSHAARFGLNAGLALNPSLFTTSSLNAYGLLAKDEVLHATEYGLFGGVLLRPTYRLTGHLTLNASFQVQERFFATVKNNGYGELNNFYGRHSASLGLAYEF